ncbi:MAG: acyl-CoA dehydrogenase family protein [Acidobacteriota bacterium]
MKELLNARNLDYIEQAKEVADKYIRPVATELDREQRYPWSVIEALKKANLMGIWVPAEYGGQGAGLLNLCLVIEEISKACGGVGVAYAVNALGSFPIILGGTEEQKKRWLPYVASGEKLVAFGLSEIESGSDAASMKTQARRENGHYVLNGVKKWNTNGGIADLYTVYCITDPTKGTRGSSALIVEKGMEGFIFGKEEDKMGIRCVAVRELEFKNCKVSAENLLGGREGRGFANAMATLDRARPGVAAQAVGLAQGAFDLAMEYAKKRKQFGQSLTAFQGIQWMFAEMATQIEAARQLVYSVARAADAGAKSISKASAMAKLFATDTAMKVTTDCVQIFGGYGYMKDYPIEKYMRDAKITQIYEGTNQIQRIVIARNLLREYAAAE